MSEFLAQDRIVFLGTKGGPRQDAGSRWPTSMMLIMGGQAFLVDAGLGVTRQFREAGFDYRHLDQVFLTHLHSDHTLELGGILHTAWTSSPPQKRRVHGPLGTDRLMKGFLMSQSFDIDIRVEDEGQADLNKLLDWKEFGEGLIYDDGRVQVTALRVEHPPVTECYALKFQCEGKAVVFGADTRYFEPLSDFAKGADVLVHEVMHGEEAKKICEALKAVKPNLWEHFVLSHTPAEQVGELATKAGVKHLVLNHYVPQILGDITPELFLDAVGQTWAGQLTASDDLMVVSY